MAYDPEGLRDYFDAFGEAEAGRLADSLQGRIKFAVHRHVLARHLAPGLEVLDVGCGPATFAVPMATAGASLTLVDISSTQLELAEARLREAGLIGQVRELRCLDATSLASLGDGAYDLVVAYGSVVSYGRERYPEILGALAGVTKAGGRVVLSVTSLYGTMRLIGALDAVGFIAVPQDHLDWQGLLDGADVVLTRAGSSEFHQPMALFTADGLGRGLAQAGLVLEELATSNPLVPERAAIRRVSGAAAAARHLEALEIALCRHPGLIETGEHLIAVARKPD